MSVENLYINLHGNIQVQERVKPKHKNLTKREIMHKAGLYMPIVMLLLAQFACDDMKLPQSVIDQSEKQPTAAVVAEAIETPEVIGRPESMAVWMPPVANQYWPEIIRWSEKYGIKPEVVASLILIESAYNPDAVSKAGAVGLGQHMPATGMGVASGIKAIGSEYNPYNPEDNIRVTAKHLKDLIVEFNNDLEKGLLAYYRGGPNVKAGNYSENDRKYALTIMDLANDWYHQESDTYNKWLRSMVNSGGLHLKIAFDQQGLSYNDYVNSVFPNHAGVMVADVVLQPYNGPRPENDNCKVYRGVYGGISVLQNQLVYNPDDGSFWDPEANVAVDLGAVAQKLGNPQRLKICAP